MFINETFTDEKIRAMHETMVRLYEAAKTLKGLETPTEVARALNQSQQTINNWERRGISQKGMLIAQAEIGCNGTWLQTGAPPMETVKPHFRSDQIETKLKRGAEALAYNPPTSAGPMPTPLSYPADTSKFRRIYLVGRANGGLPERIWTDGDYPVGATDKYAELASPDPQAFLTAVMGTSMVPRFNPGEFALVEPNTEPEAGDDVLVRLASGETMIKKLNSLRGGVVELYSYNEREQGPLFFQPQDITWMYYIAHPVPARKMKTRM